MKRLTSLLLVILILVSKSNAQLWKSKRYQISSYIGTSHFFCDGTREKNVIGLKDITLQQTRFTFGLALKYWMVEDATIKGSAAYTMLHGTNVGRSNSYTGFSVTSELKELNLGGEYYFLRNKARDSYRFSKGEKGTVSFTSLIDIYATVGVGAALFNVRPDNSSDTRIQKDHGIALTAPAGLGFNIVLTPEISTGAEMLLHSTFSDYLDGYTNQTTSRNDVFCTLGLSFTYRFKISANTRKM